MRNLRPYNPLRTILEGMCSRTPFCLFLERRISTQTGTINRVLLNSGIAVPIGNRLYKDEWEPPEVMAICLQLRWSSARLVIWRLPLEGLADWGSSA